MHSRMSWHYDTRIDAMPTPAPVAMYGLFIRPQIYHKKIFQ